jgi:catechol 2,3-dioxygenase-like lactoylglutathione lyase family enzyme
MLATGLFFILTAVPQNSSAHDSSENLQPPFEYMITKIVVANLDKSIEFYSRFFGYKEVLRTPRSAAGVINVYTTKGGQNYQHGLTFVHKAGVSKPIEKGALHTIVFSVKDIAGLVNRIEAAGYEITMAPRETKNYSDSVTSSAVIAYALDPDGYPVEMVEWKL